MILKRAIKAFLDRQLEDYRRYKKLTWEQLIELKDQLPVKPPIWKPLRQHQRVCFLAGAKTGRFYFQNDTGTGKTLLSIALIRYFAKLKKNKCVLVLVPNKILKYEWAREIKKHSPGTKYCILRGSSADKWKQLEATDALIVVETFAGLIRMVCTFVASKKGKKKPRLKPNAKQIKRLMLCIDGLVMDESTVVKNHRKLPYRICRQISKSVATVFALTGTPFGRDPIDLWAQMYLVDKGETLGPTLGLFRAAFFKASDNFWGGFNYAIDPKKLGLLHRTVANRSLRYAADKSDLPALVQIEKFVSLPQTAELYYKKARDSVIAAQGNYLEMKNAFLRMRQISSGFVGYYDDEEGTRAQFEFPTNPKLELLLSTLESIRPDRKVLVFHDFIYSGAVISRGLTELGIKHVRLHSKTKDAAALLHEFDHDPACRVFVLAKAGFYGLNLQSAQYGLVYESPVAVILRKQMERRFERQESKHRRVFLYDFMVRGTVDERIREFHAEGQSYFDAIVEGKAKADC